MHWMNLMSAGRQPISFDQAITEVAWGINDRLSEQEQWKVVKPRLTITPSPSPHVDWLVVISWLVFLASPLICLVTIVFLAR